MLQGVWREEPSDPAGQALWWAVSRKIANTGRKVETNRPKTGMLRVLDPVGRRVLDREWPVGKHTQDTHDEEKQLAVAAARPLELSRGRWGVVAASTRAAAVQHQEWPHALSDGSMVVAICSRPRFLRPHCAREYANVSCLAGDGCYRRD